MKKLFWDEYLNMLSGLGFMVIFVGIFLVLLFFGFYLDRLTCYLKYENYKPQWGLVSGCRIMWQDKLTPVKMITNINY